MMVPRRSLYSLCYALSVAVIGVASVVSRACRLIVKLWRGLKHVAINAVVRLWPQDTRPWRSAATVTIVQLRAHACAYMKRDFGRPCWRTPHHNWGAV